MPIQSKLPKTKWRGKADTKPFQLINLKFERYYFIATYILAFVAVLGFIFSIGSSKKTAHTLNLIDKNIAALTEPAITLETVQWFRGEQLDCNHPPIGVQLYIKNGSVIPIKILNDSISFRFNFSDNEIKTHKFEHTFKTVLPVNNFTGTSIQWGSFMDRLIKNYTPESFVIIKYYAFVSNLNETKKYRVELHYKIYLDCKLYPGHHGQLMNSIYTEI